MCLLGNGFDAFEQPNAYRKQAGGEHHAQQGIGDHNVPNLSHQCGERSDLAQQRSDTSGGGRSLGTLLLSLLVMVAGAGFEPAASRVRT